MLRFRHKMTLRKLKVYPEGGPEARLKKLRQIVTGLIRYERVEPTYSQADEARQYAERLIYLAMKNGDQHTQTMETLDYWILEKDLIHKLFKVIVPRYQNTNSSYTNLYRLAVEYPGRGVERGVLELKDNPWPPIKLGQRNNKFILSNMLLSAAKHDYYTERQRRSEDKMEVDSNNTTNDMPSPSSTPSSSSSIRIDEDSSSVDPPLSGR